MASLRILVYMTTIQEIEEAVVRLSQDDLACFSDWFSQFSASVWDARIDADARSGKLDPLADAALKSLEEGRCTEL